MKMAIEGDRIPTATVTGTAELDNHDAITVLSHIRGGEIIGVTPSQGDHEPSRRNSTVTEQHEPIIREAGQHRKRGD